MTTPDELADRVARLYEDKWGIKDHSLARAAVAVALEEAANVADGEAVTAAGDEYQSDRPGHFWDRESIYGTGRSDAAAAIRALKEKDNG